MSEARASRRSLLLALAVFLPSTRTQRSQVEGLRLPSSTRSSLLDTHWWGLGVGSAVLVAGVAGSRSWGSWRATTTAAPSTATSASPAVAAITRSGGGRGGGGRRGG